MQTSLRSDTTRLARVSCSDGSHILEEIAQNPRCDVGAILVDDDTHAVFAVAFNYLRREWQTVDPEVRPPGSMKTHTQTLIPRAHKSQYFAHLRVHPRCFMQVVFAMPSHSCIATAQTCDHGVMMRHVLQYKEDFEVLSRAAPGDFGISSRSADNQVRPQAAGIIAFVLYPQHG